MRKASYYSSYLLFFLILFSYMLRALRPQGASGSSLPLLEDALKGLFNETTGYAIVFGFGQSLHYIRSPSASISADLGAMVVAAVQKNLFSTLSPLLS